VTDHLDILCAGGFRAAMEALAPRFEARTPEERLARAERLLEAHRNTEAAEALESIRGAKLDAAQTCRHRYALGRAHRKARVWAKARAPMDEAVVACARAQHAHAPWTLYQQAQILELYHFDVLRDRYILKLNPMVLWSREQVWEHIRRHQIPYNVLQDRGYRSIGCMPCTRATDGGEDERAGRWTGFDKAECGIHTFLGESI
jgi:3'-phosphoadenosine 5'-phosphosulfate sulfotransferase (PAPS reductase)/FAD synthetase